MLFLRCPPFTAQVCYDQDISVSDVLVYAPWVDKASVYAEDQQRNNENARKFFKYPDRLPKELKMS